MVEHAAAPSDEEIRRGHGYVGMIAQHVRAVPTFQVLQRVQPKTQGFAVAPLTYSGLAYRAQAFAAFLREHDVGFGDRVLLSMSDPHDLFAAVVGALSMGAVIVPLQTAAEFGTLELFRERMIKVAADCQPRLVVVDDLNRWHKTMDGRMQAPVAQAQLQDGAAPELPFEPCPGETPAIIQYTSGSTGNPKGVVLTHGNIAANVRTMALTSGLGPEDRFVSWLPLHHDMGLIGALLMNAYWKIPHYIMSPAAFLSRPVTWLRAIDEFRATLTVAPTFAYALCWRKIPDSQLAGLDLSSCRIAFCGAEPVDPEVVRGFTARLARFGLRPNALYPVYGLAEATLAVAFPEPGTVPVIDRIDRQTLARDGLARPAPEGSPDAVSFVSVGAAVQGHSVQVVDAETRQACPERRVGEIVVRGPSLSPRYYHEDPAATRAELATGDLGYVADGRLYVIDRLKDLVIIRGQNFAPADLEPCAGRAKGVRKGRVVAFSLPGPEGSEQLHLVAELDPRSLRPQSAIREEMRRHVLEVFGIEVAGVALVAPGSIPRTTSGKLRRRPCRDRYAAGCYPPALSWAARLGCIRRFVVGRLRRASLRLLGARGPA